MLRRQSIRERGLLAAALAFFLFIIPIAGFTQPEAVAPNDGPTLWLVMIDVSEYSNGAIPATPAAKQHMDGFENFFRAMPREAPPFARRRLWRLTSGDASGKTHPKADMIRAIFANSQWGLLSNARPGDSVLFCFAGQGTETQDGKYLLPMDANLANIQGSSIPLSEIEQWQQALAAAGAHMDIYLICDFSFDVAASPAGVATPPTPDHPADSVAPASHSTIEGYVVFDDPPAGKSIVHRLVLQDESGRQAYVSWDKAITDAMPADQRPRLGARLAVRYGSQQDEEGAIAVTNPEDIRNLGASSSPVWPPRAEIGQLGTAHAHKAIWTEGIVTGINEGADPIPTFITLQDPNVATTIQVVTWQDTVSRLKQAGKMPKPGDRIRIGALVQLYRGEIQLRFHHPEHLAVVK